MVEFLSYFTVWTGKSQVSSKLKVVNISKFLFKDRKIFFRLQEILFKNTYVKVYVFSGWPGTCNPFCYSFRYRQIQSIIIELCVFILIWTTIGCYVRCIYNEISFFSFQHCNNQLISIWSLYYRTLPRTFLLFLNSVIDILKEPLGIVVT